MSKPLRFSSILVLLGASSIFILPSVSLGGITRTSVSSIVANRPNDLPDSRSSAGPDFPRLATPTDGVDTSSTETSSYIRNVTRTASYDVNWGSARASASGDVVVTSKQAGTNLVYSQGASVSVIVSDDLFFSHAGDPTNTDPIKITVYRRTFVTNQNYGRANTGSLEFGSGSGLPASFSFYGFDESLNDGESLVSLPFEFELNDTQPLVSNSIGLESFDVWVTPNDENTLAYSFTVEWSTGLSKTNANVGDSISAGSGLRAGLDTWIDVPEGVILTTDSGYDYRVIPVPEPASLSVVFSIVSLGLVAVRRRRSN